MAALGSGAVGATASLVAAPPPAGAEAVGNCTASTGVIVVVDFAHWGGTVERGCAAAPTTGYDALHTAGFTTAGDEHDGPSFVCRIDTRPTPTQTPCVSTPPASAYWSYWHADAGQTTWSYSQLGAAAYQPPPGSVTAWIFGGTNVTGASGTGRPTFTPTEVRATNPVPAGGGSGTATTAPASPTVTATSPPASSAIGGAGTPPASPGDRSPGGGAASPARTGTSGGPLASPPSTSSTGSTGTETTGPASTTTPPPAPGAATTTPRAASGKGASTGKGSGSAGGRSAGPHGGARADAGPTIVNVDPGSAGVASPPGSPAPAVVGVAVVALLAAAGGAVARRRRRASRSA